MARKNDIQVLLNDAAAFEASNRGDTPGADDLAGFGLDIVTSVIGSGKPTTDKAVYTVGLDCDGVAGEQTYSIAYRSFAREWIGLLRRALVCRQGIELLL